MLTQILDKLDAWVGRSFLLASFFPLLIFVGANALMAQLLMPDAVKQGLQYLADSAYGPISATFVCLAATAALAYVLDPLVGTMTRFLEGRFFPESVARWLSTDQTRKFRDLEEEALTTGRARTAITDGKKQLLARLGTARDAGAASGAMRDAGSIATARTKINELEILQDEQRPIPFDNLQAAAELLIAALEKNCADPGLLKGDLESEKKGSRSLYAMFVAMRRLLDYAENKASEKNSRAVDERDTAFAIDELPSTNFGNQAAALRGFFQKRFNFDFEFFWPIIQVVLLADAKTMDAIVSAKQKVDFCVRLFMYTIVFTAIWLGAALFLAEHIFVVPLLGTLGFAAAAIWLEIIHANYRAFSEQVRSIVILKRFDVLKQLRIKLPATWEEEKKIWDAITTQLRWGSGDDVAYQHPEK